MFKGSCLCGAVTFEAAKTAKEAVACHCSQCRKVTGNFDVSVEVAKSYLTIHDTTSLRWYHTTKVRRGFCATCGSHLFFDPPHLDWVGVAMGAFDAPTGVRLAQHIFCADKGDWYEITDGLPQNAQ
ncbi:GFA family protein [Celeribacter sp.]|uniref:GFA family protein n=1 Tax=Celeribacter sp. TaxID=1890673 RepID=UPI003A9286A1